MTQSSLISTYKSPKQIKNTVAVSSQGFSAERVQPSANFASDTSRLAYIAALNGFTISYPHYMASAQVGGDTLSVLAFGNYANGQNKECLYLLKNSQPVDSVINDFAITHMQPVPLATESLQLYATDKMIPETDIYWTDLTGIDTQNFRFVFYKRSRLPLE